MNRLQKIATTIAVVAGAIGMAGFAGATSIITFASSQVASVLDYTDTLFTDLIYLVALAIGLPLAFWVIRRVIGLVRAR